ncbi:hypothetical protein CTEN210_18449 [Chaetoceros tenuissimus]|uniref:Ankyrin repeat-containing protein n=1 Tax=Chaetoceros tenuissimus TaxID=426638 RepID=A0AAD3DCQ3_9STRA|nr:hypothetical protein CTEN210_18449 [Chaetoceros tenuissimus]
MSSNRGIKRACTGAEKASYGDVKHIQDLPDDLFQICLDFVGPGNFAFVAPVSKHFYWQYINLSVNCTVFDTNTALQQGRNKRTATNVVVNGSLRFVTECFMNSPREFKEKVCHHAVANGRLDILDCAVSLGVSMRSLFLYGFGEKFSTKALKNGHLNVIEFLATEGVRFDTLSNERLLQNDNVSKYFHWMMTKDMIVVNKEKMAAYLARDGELEILKEHYQDCITDEVFKECVKGGHIVVMEWMLQISGYEIDPSIFPYAVESGSIPMMELCLGRLQDGYHLPIKFPFMIPKGQWNTLDILKWLDAQRCTFTVLMCDTLAGYGDVEALKWAREKGYDWDQSTFKNAVSSGDIATLEYCLKNDCPCPDGPTVYESVYERSPKEDRYLEDNETLKVYKCLHEHDFPWDQQASPLAARKGHDTTMKWAIDHGCPWHESILHFALSWPRANMAFLDYIIGYCIRNNIDVHQIRIENYYRGVMTGWSRTEVEIIKIIQIFRDHNIHHFDLDNIISTAESLGKTNVARWLRCNAF